MNWSSNRATRHSPLDSGSGGGRGFLEGTSCRAPGFMHPALSSQHSAGILGNKEEWDFTSDPVEFFVLGRLGKKRK